MKTVVLAYSGGLDTSVILKWLIKKGYDVVCYMADVGQEEDFDKAKEKALKVGAKAVYIQDMKEEFVTGYIFPALKANAIYEGKYLLGTSLARPLIAKGQIEIAKKVGTTIVAHGATGKGNDQVRFEIAYMTLMPDVTIISPWKDPSFLAEFKGRSDLIDFAKKEGIPIESTHQKPYSMDDNLMHISYEAGQLENPAFSPDPAMFKKTVHPKDAPDKETKLTIEFSAGIPVKVTDHTQGKEVTGALKLFMYLNEVGGKNGVGRKDLVENRFVGMKSRGVYETPAGTILREAHLDIEGLVLDKEASHLKDSFMSKIAELIYNGFWFTPEMRMLMAMVDESQKGVAGKVHLTLYKGNVMVSGRESTASLYDADIASMDKLGGYDQTDAIGFIRLNALRLKMLSRQKVAR